MKQIVVTFNYNPETDVVSDVVCSVDGVEKKKRTTKKLKDITALEEHSIITLESNKLIFNNKCASEMELQYEDRVVIKWEKRDNRMVPIIGKDLAFEEEGTGNKLTKSNTITYKGKANTILADYGSEFKIQSLKDGIWELVPTSESKVPSTLEEILEEAENTEADLITNSDEEIELDNLKFQL